MSNCKAYAWIMMAVVAAGTMPAFGQSATEVSISVVEGADPGPYSAARTEDEGFTGSFTIWTQVDSDGDVDGLQYRLHVNGGTDDALFRITAYAEGPLSAVDSSFDGLGELFAIAGPPDGFGTGDYDKLTLPVALDAVPQDELVFNLTQLVDDAAFPGTLIGYVVEPVSALSAGTYEFSADGAIASGGDGEFTATPNSGMLTNGGNFTLTIEAAGTGGGGGGDPGDGGTGDGDGGTGDGDTGDGDTGDGDTGDGDTGDGDSGDGDTGDGDTGGGSGDGGDTGGDGGDTGGSDGGDTGSDADPTPAPVACGAGTSQAMMIGMVVSLAFIGHRRRR